MICAYFCLHLLFVGFTKKIINERELNTENCNQIKEKKQQQQQTHRLYDKNFNQILCNIQM